LDLPKMRFNFFSIFSSSIATTFSNTWLLPV
jgi:hypothetical protein